MTESEWRAAEFMRRASVHSLPMPFAKDRVPAILGAAAVKGVSAAALVHYLPCRELAELATECATMDIPKRFNCC